MSTPTVLTLPRAAPRRVLAFGAWLKNSAGLLEGDRFLPSALHGDLGTPEACIALERSVQALVAAAGGPIEAVAHDLHPDFHSTRLALHWAERLGVPAIGVQHHQAHLAVLQAEAGLDGPLLGLALDGVGLGTDGTAWGGELLRLDAHGGFERLAHLPPLALPGGDVAAREPWRLVAAVLHALGRGDEIGPRLAPGVGAAAAQGVQTMLARGLNCPVSTGAGRWFDAAAGVLGLSVRQREEAEAAIALERCAAGWLERHPQGVAVAGVGPRVREGDGAHGGGLSGDLGAAVWALFEALLAVDLQDAEACGRGAALFHAGLADALAEATLTAAERDGLHDVAFGGGCFFNRLLSQRLSARLTAAGLRVHRPQAVSCGDAGLALGQAWAAAAAIQSNIPTET
ncbi:Kae1-like domain-containing protein [Sphaerotilus natans]|uniref:Kae1-like domain-containing protein n=1 Tax=Sphaerotilus natans TaxID=34103 RepID=UPI00406D11FF